MAQFFTPWVDMILVVVAVLLALTLVPNLAYRVSNGFDRGRRFLLAAAKAIWGNIKRIWSREGEKKRQEEHINRLTYAEVRKQEAKKNGVRLTDDEIAQIKKRITDELGEPRNPNSNEITSAWVRRIIYLLLVVVCVGSDYVLVSTRAPILFGGGEAPGFMKTLFQYLQVITGVLFVSIAALSGMLIQEQTTGLPVAVKLEPDAGELEKKIKLGLAIFMFALDVVVVVFLTIGGILQQYLNAKDLEVVVTVFVGTSALVAIAIFLAWPGWYQALEGLGTLVIGGAAALICLLASAICAIIGGIIGLFGLINAALYGITHREGKAKPPEPVENRDLTIIGFGSQGSTFAEGICRQVRALQGEYAWLAGYYMPNATLASRMKNRLSNMHVAAAVVTPDTDSQTAEDAADALVKTLDQGYFSNRTTVVKRLIWVAYGDDLEASRLALQKLDAVMSGQLVGAQAQAGGAPTVNDQNIRLVILWLVPDPITAELKQTAEELNNWAKKSGSILATTVVIQDNCPLAGEMKGKYSEVLHRSIAALLVAGDYNASANFAAVAQQMHNAQYSFSALEAGSIGVNTARTAFQDGPVYGSRGDINSATASRILKLVAAKVFPAGNQTLSTVKENLAAVPFINLVVPERLRQLDEFKQYVNDWLRAYGVNQGQVTIEQLGNTNDKGIDISGASSPLRIWKGDYYFHFTAFRRHRPGKLG